jgi:hypothetical protein
MIVVTLIMPNDGSTTEDEVDANKFVLNEGTYELHKLTKASLINFPHRSVVSSSLVASYPVANVLSIVIKPPKE